MKFGTVCSGIEAASVAWRPLGWEPAFFAENARFPSAVLAHHYPHVANLGDLNDFHSWPGFAIDALAGGTPCQSYSVAGLREGLADPRGNLTLVYLAVASRFRPRWLVWENVPGILSNDGGRAFGTFLGGLAELGYGWAYRILDAQHFGLAQRRRRVWVVGYLGAWAPAAAVLFESSSMRWDSPPRREARERDPGPSEGGARNGSSVTGPLMHHHGWRDLEDKLVANTARMSKGINTTLDEGQTLIPCAFNARQDPISDDVSMPLDTDGTSIAVIDQSQSVRRLTPRECERLQGFPDDYTRIRVRSKIASDSARYQALGNSWPVHVARWIGERIDFVQSLSLQPQGNYR